MIEPTKLMRGAVLAFALLFAAPLAGVGGPWIGVEAAQAATVGKISVQGNSKVDNGAVINLLALRVGDQATSAKVNASIQSLVSSGLFKTVSVNMQGSTLVVRVSENPIVASVLFEGNQRFSDANLVAMIDSNSRSSLDQGALARDVQSIKQAYIDQGYSSVGVTTRQDATGDGRVRVVFVINEGSRSGIAAINFTGNNSINAWTLKSVIRTHETSFLSWLLRDDNYTQDQLDIDRELLRQYYGNHGFPDAQVTSAVAEYDAKRNGYFINYTIVEGERYSYGKIGVETSIKGLDANTLTGTIRTQQGNRYNSAELQKSAEDMAFAATQRGYPFADVRPRLDRDPATGTFNVTYLVDEGQRIYVERVNITGNEKTRDFVIRRELDFAEGDPFNRSLLARDKTKIEALGFFSKVDVALGPGSAPDKVVININVTESSTGDYGASVGYSSEDGVLGELSLTERNFLGRGQYLKASIGATLGGNQSYEFAFTEPRFMGLNISAGISVYQKVTVETDDNYYGTTRTGGQLTFGAPVMENVRASVFGGFEQNAISDSDPADSIIFGGGAGAYDGHVFNKGWVGYGLTYNGLDDQKHPTEGLIATLTQQYEGIDFNLIKTEAKARYYMPLLDDAGIVGSIKVTGGIVNDLSGGDVNPIEAFGGGDLARGFVGREMGPRTGGQALGFTAYASASAEVTFPIPMLPETYGLSGAVWADAAIIDGNGGSGSIDATSVDQPLKSSVGASVIWDSPFGPLRGDFAYVLTKATDDKTQMFALTLQRVL